MKQVKVAVRIRRPGVTDLPPRTRLYSLAPRALGSIWCESLTGYINRLGWTHHVSPRMLVAEMIDPQLPSPTPFVAVFCMQPAMALNGNGGQASVWSEVVGQLTGRTDLHHLTLATLLGDFPRSGFSAGPPPGVQLVSRNGRTLARRSISHCSGWFNW